MSLTIETTAVEYCDESGSGLTEYTRDAMAYDGVSAAHGECAYVEHSTSGFYCHVHGYGARWIG